MYITYNTSSLAARKQSKNIRENISEVSIIYIKSGQCEQIVTDFLIQGFGSCCFYFPLSYLHASTLLRPAQSDNAMLAASNVGNVLTPSISSTPGTQGRRLCPVSSSPERCFLSSFLVLVLHASQINFFL